MKIRKAKSKQDYAQAMTIAKDLKEWFNKDGIKAMKVDFAFNPLVVATDKEKVVGFLSYTCYDSIMRLIWIGVSKEYQRKGIGKALVDWLATESKKLGSESHRDRDVN